MATMYGEASKYLKKIEKIEAGHKNYLTYHREKIFKKIIKRIDTFYRN